MAIDVGGQHRDGVGDDFELYRQSEGYAVPQIVIEGSMSLAYSRAGAAGLTEVSRSSQSQSGQMGIRIGFSY